jgi:hypothetical protein
MLAVAKTPHIRVQITGVGARAVASALKKAIPGITITDDSESEPLRGSGWFEKMEAELTPGRALRVYRAMPASPSPRFPRKREFPSRTFRAWNTTSARSASLTLVASLTH